MFILEVELRASMSNGHIFIICSCKDIEHFISKFSFQDQFMKVLLHAGTGVKYVYYMYSYFICIMTKVMN
jgi:hypothetical protein